MISEIRAHFKSIAIGKLAEVTTSNCGEAAVVVTAAQNETGNIPNSMYLPFQSIHDSYPKV